MKKLVAVLVVLLMVLGVSAALAEDAEVPTYTCGLYRYQVLDDGTAMITFYWGMAKNLEIVSELDGLTVTAIADDAFSWRSTLNSVTIPDTITSIVGNPFRTCYNLTDIVLSPEHPILATIDGVLFEKTTKTLICYPKALTTESYTIPNGITAISDKAFYSCNSISCITIPDSVISIGSEAFCNTPFLKSIIIPDSITSIGDSAFSGCGITSVIIPNGVTNIGNNVFSNCTNLSSITIPDNITAIGDNAFSGCGIASITIPNSVVFIGTNPFSKCDKLTEISVHPEQPVFETINGVLFEKATKTLVCYPCAFASTSYTIPDDTIVIGNRAFYFCDNLSSITIPASVTAIGEDAFADCPNLTLTVSRDSYAAQWCKDNGMPYTYPDANDWLNN